MAAEVTTEDVRSGIHSEIRGTSRMTSTPGRTQLNRQAAKNEECGGDVSYKCHLISLSQAYNCSILLHCLTCLCSLYSILPACKCSCAPIVVVCGICSG